MPSKVVDLRLAGEPLCVQEAAGLGLERKRQLSETPRAGRVEKALACEESKSPMGKDTSQDGWHAFLRRQLDRCCVGMLIAQWIVAQARGSNRFGAAWVCYRRKDFFRSLWLSGWARRLRNQEEASAFEAIRPVCAVAMIGGSGEQTANRSSTIEVQPAF
jgi:hypothetical protein